MTRHFTVDAVSWTEKLNLLNNQCFYRNNVRCQKLQQLFEVQSFGLDTGPQSFCYSFIALHVDNTLFEVSPEIRWSGVSSPCCYGNIAAGSKPILKTF